MTYSIRSQFWHVNTNLDSTSRKLWKYECDFTREREARNYTNLVRSIYLLSLYSRLCYNRWKWIHDNVSIVVFQDIGSME